MANDTVTKKGKLEELILKKRQQEEAEKEALRQKRPREDDIDQIDFGDDSDDDESSKKGTYVQLLFCFRVSSQFLERQNRTLPVAIPWTQVSIESRKMKTHC